MKAVILGAGLGTRLQNLLMDLPKPMLPLQGIPLLEYTVRHLVGLGISEIGINLFHQGEKIENHFGDGKKFESKITYAWENAPTGTAGGTKSLEKFLIGSKTFLVIYGDILTNFDFSTLIQFHQHHGKMASLVLHERTKSNSIVEMDNKGCVTSFLERPDPSLFQEGKTVLVNSGFYCFSEGILNHIPDGVSSDFPKDIFPGLIQRGELYGFPLGNADRVAIDSEERYEKANAMAGSKEFLKKFRGKGMHS
jgi:NDP-sugar pyrophosphorylase family protein